jgi:hypothetical protein
MLSEQYELSYITTTFMYKLQYKYTTALLSSHQSLASDQPILMMNKTTSQEAENLFGNKNYG